MRTSASVALSWNQCLLNHTVEPLKSLTVGSAQLTDQTGLATLHYSKVVAGRENGNVEEGAQRTHCIRWKLYPYLRELRLDIARDSKTKDAVCAVLATGGNDSKANWVNLVAVSYLRVYIQGCSCHVVGIVISPPTRMSDQSTALSYAKVSLGETLNTTLPPPPQSLIVPVPGPDEWRGLWQKFYLIVRWENEAHPSKTSPCRYHIAAFFCCVWMTEWLFFIMTPSTFSLLFHYF